MKRLSIGTVIIFEDSAVKAKAVIMSDDNDMSLGLGKLIYETEITEVFDLYGDAEQTAEQLVADTKITTYSVYHDEVLEVIRCK